MNLSRLLVLSLLRRHGPRHGHLIRLDVEGSSAYEWAGVSVGPLYRELRDLEAAGLVQALRTEQMGRRPTRTVYGITPEGERELRLLWEQALLMPRTGPDAVAVALLCGADADEARALLLRRGEAVRRERDAIAVEVARLRTSGTAETLEWAALRRGELLRTAELAWLDETLARIASSGEEERWTAPPGERLMF